MAINFSSVETTQWIGAVNGIPTTLCGDNGRMVWVPINWLIYGVGDGDNLGLEVDMSGIAVTNMLDLIRSVYIDNLASPTAIYILFPDTGFTAFMPPYSKGWCPVLTNARKATIYGIGFNSNAIPLTNVFFTNIFVPDSITTAGPDANIIAATATYTGSAIITTGAGGVQATFNHAAFPFGTAAASRRILIGAFGMLGSGTGLGNDAVINSITIGGIVGALSAQANISARLQVGPTDQTWRWNGCFAIAAVPTGATGTVSVVFNNARNSCRIFGWEIAGVTDDTVLDRVGISGGGGTNVAIGALALQNSFNAAARGCAASFCIGGLTGVAAITDPVVSGSTPDVGGITDTIDGAGVVGNYNTSSTPMTKNDIVAANPAQLITSNYSNVQTGLMFTASIPPS